MAFQRLGVALWLVAGQSAGRRFSRLFARGAGA